MCPPRSKRPIHKRIAPPDTIGGATVAAIRYVRYAPAIRALTLRSGVVMFFASALFAPLPTVAHTAGHSVTGYGILLGSLGAGAVGGAMLMQPARVRWSTEAAGNGVWGSVGAHANVDTALPWAGLGTIATTALGLIARLPDTTADVSPWNHRRVPAIVKDVALALEQGPVLVTVEYLVDQQHAKAFLRAMHRYGRVKRRDGASGWGLFRDVEHPDVYLETFLVSSWAEHLRQHERSTLGDRDLEDRLHSYARGEPNVRHLIHVKSED